MSDCLIEKIINRAFLVLVLAIVAIMLPYCLDFIRQRHERKAKAKSQEEKLQVEEWKKIINKEINDLKQASKPMPNEKKEQVEILKYLIDKSDVDLEARKEYMAQLAELYPNNTNS